MFKDTSAVPSTITRRGFIAALSCLPFVKHTEPSLSMYFDMGKLTKLPPPLSGYHWEVLEGIPYHESNATTGEWLGIKRA